MTALDKQDRHVSNNRSKDLCKLPSHEVSNVSMITSAGSAAISVSVRTADEPNSRRNCRNTEGHIFNANASVRCAHVGNELDYITHILDTGRKTIFTTHNFGAGLLAHTARRRAHPVLDIIQKYLGWK
jgi:hypothetical protein